MSGQAPGTEFIVKDGDQTFIFPSGTVAPRLGAIVIEEANLHMVLMKHWDKIQSRDRWIGPLGLFAALLLGLLTADFKNAMGLEKEAWRDMFIIGAFVSFFWTAFWVCAAWKPPTVDKLVKEIKGEQFGK